MLRYFGAALLARLGGVPLNLLGVLLFFVLGVALSPWWLIPLVLQLLFTGALAVQPRFQKVVDAQKFSKTSGAQAVSAQEQREQLAAQLKRETRARYDIWERRGEQILERQKATGADEFALENNRAAIGHLLLIYLRLLLARQNLLSEDIEVAHAQLQAESAALQAELAREDLSGALRESKTSTLQLVQQRAEKIGKRHAALQEVESDLSRLEAHFNLSLEQAIGSAKPQTVRDDIQLATQLLDSEYSEAFGVMSDEPTAETTVSNDEGRNAVSM